MRPTAPAVAVAALCLVLALGTALALFGDMPERWRQPKDLPQPERAPGHVPPDEEYDLADNVSLELVVDGLTYPTALAWDDEGALYVVEAGYSYGPSLAIPRVLEVGADGELSEVARFPDGPVTGLAWHEGALYAVGGRAPASVWSVDPAEGNVSTVLTGFPVWGHHFTSDLVVSEDGWMYFGVGDPTNAGVLGLDDYYTYGYLSIFPEARSLPCVDVVLRGQDVETPNPFDGDPRARTRTGAFHRFGEPASANETVPAGEPPRCNGALFRARTNGTGLEVVASGLRHVTGLALTANGSLLAAEEGMQPEGSRPVANACDALWEITEGAWYGFPDFACGEPVTEPGFHPPNRSAPQPLLAQHPDPPGEPLHRLGSNNETRHIALGPGEPFGAPGELFVAQSGSHFVYPPEGHQVLRVDLSTGEQEVVYRNHAVGVNGTAPERPYALGFGPDGALYLVDHGELVTTTKVFHPSALTGAVWRIAPDGAGDGSGGSGTASAYLPLLALGACALSRRGPQRNEEDVP